MFLVIGRVSCEPENRDDFIAALERMQDHSRLEDGCVRYGFFEAVEDPDSFIAVEEWADREALDAHFDQDHLRAFARSLLELSSSQPEIAIHEVATTSPYPR